MSYVYSAGSRFRCDPKTGIIEEAHFALGISADFSERFPLTRYEPLPPVPKNWKDTRKQPPKPKPVKHWDGNQPVDIALGGVW